MWTLFLKTTTILVKLFQIFNIRHFDLETPFSVRIIECPTNMNAALALTLGSMGFQCIPMGRPSWPIRVFAAATTPPPSGRTRALSCQLPFCGRSYSAEAERVKTNCEESCVSSQPDKLYRTDSVLSAELNGRRNGQITGKVPLLL